MAKTRIVLVESFEEDIVVTGRVLTADSRFQLVATTTNPLSVRELSTAHRPDLVLLDLALLRRGTNRLSISLLVGDAFRLALLTDHVDSATPTAKAEATRAFFEGALGPVFRPNTGPGAVHSVGRSSFCDQVFALARTNRARVQTPAPFAWFAGSPPLHDERVEVVGVIASTGGPRALAQLLKEPLRAPVLVALHMPPGFTRGFARTLQLVTKQEVRVAENGARAEPDKIYLAPDGMDLGISRSLELCVGVRAPNSVHPSGNVVFEDLAKFGRAAVGVVLTGMGDDGLEGARKLRAAGGRILAQDQASSVVFGMPGAIVAEGLADQVLPPPKIAEQLRKWVF